MASRQEIAAIRRCILNPIDETAWAGELFAGIIGDAPSRYSKSPALWNAAFADLKLNALYWPLDVDDAHLAELLMALKDIPSFLGANVTVPHKVHVMDYLDDIDPGAARIGAVNTIVRNSKGRLSGYNTDGEGFVDSVLRCQPGRDEPFLSSLTGKDVLLLGAGGSARAVAFHIADLIEGGRLLICNRTAQHAVALAQQINQHRKNAAAIGEGELSQWAPKVALIVNSTTKGQGGIRRLAKGMATLLESYSALAPANPPSFPEVYFAKADWNHRWSQEAHGGIEANHRASMRLAASIPTDTAFYDLIYHPEETVFLRHGRWTGHRTMNGKAMIINQAVRAFCERICRAELHARGFDGRVVAERVLELMYRAW